MQNILTAYLIAFFVFVKYQELINHIGIFSTTEGLLKSVFNKKSKFTLAQHLIKDTV